MAGASPHGANRWVAAWAASPVDSLGPGLVDATERMVVRAELPGARTRIRLSNALATSPVTVNDVFVGASGGGATVLPGTSHRVTFGGRSSVTIPAGVEVWSDPAPLAVAARQSVVISLFAEDAPRLTQLDDSTGVVSYEASGADHAGDVSGARFAASSDGWRVADGLAVAAAPSAGAVVAFGDSITAGFQVHPAPNLSWPALLAGRLLAEAPACPTSVLNEGISGNELTEGSASGGFGGPPALQRAGRDAFSQPGARLVIVLIGINDIGAGQVSPARVIAGYRQLIAAAHADHLRIVAGTLTPAGDPAQGSPYNVPYGGPTEVRHRVSVNRWIRTSGAFDGVIDSPARSPTLTTRTSS